jgi:hypothetical protein
MPLVLPEIGEYVRVDYRGSDDSGHLCGQETSGYVEACNDLAIRVIDKHEDEFIIPWSTISFVTFDPEPPSKEE